MRLFNSDVEKGDRRQLPLEEGEEEGEEGASREDAPRSFFELRQRTLIGLDPAPAFRLVCLSLLRKLEAPAQDLHYAEVEDSLGRYFRLLDAHMQKFATLHETLKEAADRAALVLSLVTEGQELSAPVTTMGSAIGLLQESMRAIAVVLLACGETQKRTLELKMTIQMAAAEGGEDAPALASFSSLASFLEEAVAMCNNLRRKHEELQQQRIRAMSAVAEAKGALAAEGLIPAQASGTGTSPMPSARLQNRGNPEAKRPLDEETLPESSVGVTTLSPPT